VQARESVVNALATHRQTDRGSHLISRRFSQIHLKETCIVESNERAVSISGSRFPLLMFAYRYVPSNPHDHTVRLQPIPSEAVQARESRHLVVEETLRQQRQLIKSRQQQLLLKTPSHSHIHTTDEEVREMVVHSGRPEKKCVLCVPYVLRLRSMLSYCMPGL
jgi:hypothetical protein